MDVDKDSAQTPPTSPQSATQGFVFNDIFIDRKSVV